jgi:acyl-CoA thioesterase FadM
MPVNFVIWFKRMCDMMLGQSAGQSFVTDVLEGRIAGVARWTDLRVYQPATAYESLIARAWISRMTPSGVEWTGEFFREGGSKTLQRLAFVRGEGTPVRPRAGRGFSPEMLPPKYLDQYAHFVPKQESSPDRGGAPAWDAGAALHVPVPGPGGLGLVSRELFRTTSADTDVVGNVNNVHFFMWQSQVKDLFLHAGLGPSLSEGGAELACLHSHVDYLREVMPFDGVEVTMYVGEVRERGATFHFDHHRVRPDGTTEKVAVGHQETVYLQRKDGEFATAPWPKNFQDVLLRRSSSEIIESSRSAQPKLLSVHPRGVKSR